MIPTGAMAYLAFSTVLPSAIGVAGPASKSSRGVDIFFQHIGFVQFIAQKAQLGARDEDRLVVQIFSSYFNHEILTKPARIRSTLVNVARELCADIKAPMQAAELWPVRYIQESQPWDEAAAQRQWRLFVEEHPEFRIPQVSAWKRWSWLLALGLVLIGVGIYETQHAEQKEARNHLISQRDQGHYSIQWLDSQHQPTDKPWDGKSPWFLRVNAKIAMHYSLYADPEQAGEKPMHVHGPAMIKAGQSIDWQVSRGALAHARRVCVIGAEHFSNHQKFLHQIHELWTQLGEGQCVAIEENP